MFSQYRIIPTCEQEKVIVAGVNHILHDGHDEIDFGYAGGAGTGKSSILIEIVRRSGVPLHRIAPMAYTGQAAIVLRRKGFANAKTIHSWIYTKHEEVVKDEQGREVMDPRFNRPLTKIVYRLNKSALDNIDLVIVDEAKMTPDYMARDLKSFGKKIICTGDNHQCDPIIGTPGFLNDGKEMKLTHVMRQAPGSAIIDIAYAYYNGIDVRPGMYGNDVLVIDEEDFNRHIMAYSNMTICSYNSTRDELNKWYRANVIRTDAPLPTAGERVVCKRNNWDRELDGISLVNGLAGTVRKTISANDINMKKHFFEMTFRPDHMEVDFKNIPCDLDYFTAPYQQRKYLKTTPSPNELFEYAYANTVYSAQGSEYPCGIYFRELFNRNTQHKIDYTAITRFSKMVIIVRPSYRRYF